MATPAPAADPTPALPAPQLFNLAGQNVLITGATRGTCFRNGSLFLMFGFRFGILSMLLLLLLICQHVDVALVPVCAFFFSPDL